MGKLEIVRGITNSKLYKNDNEFTDEYCKEKGKNISELTVDDFEEIDNTKYDYYNGDFWIDCDCIATAEGSWGFVKTDNEIIIIDDDDLGDLDYVEKILLHYFSKNWDDKSIAPDFDRGDWNAKLTNRDDADVWIKYRGGQGYCYAFCGYNSKDFIS